MARRGGRVKRMEQRAGRAVMLAPLACLALSACVTSGEPASPPAALGVDPFYRQYVDAAGIPVLASARVDPAALYAAQAMVEGMLEPRPDLARWLSDEGYRVAIMAVEEAITDLPENAHWTKPARDDPRLTRCEAKLYDERIGAFSDREYWNARVRGIGGQYTVAGEEDVLGLTESRYFGETILVHEFAHNVLYAIEAVDPDLYAQIEAAYASAAREGRWKDEYAMTTVHEYWAEGTQFWFESNRLAVMNNRRVLSADDLAAYDPALFAVLAQAYREPGRLAGDPFYRHPARVPPGPIPENTAEVC
jgi:hypothetical protein